MDSVTLEMNKVRDQVLGLKAPIITLLKDVEPKFIQLGNDLQSVNTMANDITQLTIETAKEIGGQTEDGFLAQIETLASTSLGELKNCQSDISLYIPNIQNGSKHLEKLQTTSSIIKKISKSLNIVAMNIGVESSRSKECEEMFSMFAQEIKRLSKKIHEISLNIFNDSAMARASQLDTLDNISERQMRLEGLADNADQTVQESVQKIHRLIGLSLSALKRVEEHSNLISDRVSEIVEAIQFQDITHQQLEHVINALADAEELCRTICSINASDSERPENMVQVYSILDLQVAHIQHVISQLEDVHMKAMNAFTGVGKEVDMLLSSGLDMKDMGEEGFEGKFMALQTALERLNQLLDQGHDLGTQIEKTMRQSSEIVSRLSGHLDLVEDISMELHIKAINAVVMSKRLGQQGRTLEVLAQEVTDVSKESNNFVFEVVETLKSISEFAKILGDCSWRSKKDQSDDSIHFDTSLTLGIDRISSAYEKIRKDSIKALEWAQALQKIISRIGSDLGFITTLKQDLLNILQQVKAVAKIFGHLNSLETKDLNVDISHSMKRYTMERERDVYRQFREKEDTFNLGKGRGSSLENESSNLVEGDMTRQSNNIPKDQEDLGDNVEFF